jgi:hypothetical protein
MKIVMSSAREHLGQAGSAGDGCGERELTIVQGVLLLMRAVSHMRTRVWSGRVVVQLQKAARPERFMIVIDLQGWVL